MNTARISACAARIEKNTRALIWLREYGDRLGLDQNAKVTIAPYLASTITGAKEAAEIMTGYAVLALPDIVRSAIKSCENTIEIDRAAILKEVADPPSSPAPETRDDTRDGGVS